MLSEIKEKIEDHIRNTLNSAYQEVSDWPEIQLEVPSERAHGHFSCNIALKSAKLLKKPPTVIAESFVESLNKSIPDSVLDRIVNRIEVKSPGFINFFLCQQVLFSVLDQIFQTQAKYGQVDCGKHKRIQIEFVSANPTGPLSIAHARQAAVGDALGNVLKFIGFDVTKEYYVNDGGNQINLLGQSIKLRAKELLGESVEFPENCYQGDYVKDIAKIFMEENKVESIQQLENFEDKDFISFGVEFLMNVIKKDLRDFHVNFDEWSFESEIANKDKIEGVLSYLGEKDFLYEKDGALWFKTTDFGDDKDRVVEKSDGSYTYLAPDIVYHKNKFDRGYDKLINIWGPDHHGYIPRIKAAAQALGRDREALEVLIVQLATIYRNGEAISMSTRKGQYVSLREVLDEVGVDVARYFFLMRHINAHLDFDLELAKRESSENPVYYIQYAYARINSINRKAKEASIVAQQSDFNLLKLTEEVDLVQHLGGFSDALIYCYNQLDPYPIVNYLFELATYFHKFYDRVRVIDSDVTLSAQRLGLVNATHIVLGNGLVLLGISRPESM